MTRSIILTRSDLMDFNFKIKPECLGKYLIAPPPPPTTLTLLIAVFPPPPLPPK